MDNKVISYRRVSLGAGCTVIFTLIGCYFLSQIRVKDYVKIFPREGVTNSASGYPESILFKVGMGLTTSPLLLVMYILGQWLGWWLEKTSFTCYKWIIYVANTLAFTGIMGENLTVLSIDPNGTWLEHRYSAYYFYLVVFPYLGLYVWVVSRIRKVHAQCMDDFSYTCKVVMIWFFFLMNGLMIVSMIWLDAKERVPINIVQWEGLFILCLFFMSHVDDKPHIFITFDLETMCLQFCIDQPKQTKPETEEQPLLNSNSCS